MAVCPARFDFKCEKTTLTFSHTVPRSLVTEAHHRPGDAKYVKIFRDAMQPIMDEHESECRAASSGQCGQCTLPTAKVLLTPMSWLHHVTDPFVNVWVNAVCANAACEMKSRQQIQDLMAIIMNSDPARPQAEGDRATPPCGVCGRRDKTFRCARCKVIAYCGKEHQKADWSGHKKVCRSPATTGA